MSIDLVLWLHLEFSLSGIPLVFLYRYSIYISISLSSQLNLASLGPDGHEQEGARRLDEA